LALRPLALACFLAAALGASHARADAFRLIVTETQTPLVPNSVAELDVKLGYYKKQGVDVELVRVQQTPSAVAALRAGGGDMANIGIDTALQLLAHDQMKLRAVVSPDKSLPYLIAAKAALAVPNDLDGKVFGVARIGSVDYTLSRMVLAKLGLSIDRLQYLVLGQPSVRAESLAAGRIDATTVSVGIWTTMPDKSGLRVLVDQPSFYRLAPFVSKLDVVTADVAQSKAGAIAGVVRGMILASRDFARDPKLWVDAMAKERPEVKRADLETLAEAYRDGWCTNGGLNLDAIKFTTDIEYQTRDFEDARRVEPAEWVDTSFVDAAIAAIGADPQRDPTGR